MFTGIIEETGSVASVAKGAKSARLTIEASKVFGDLKLGDSVAVNGVCLTVAELGGKKFLADVMNETLNRSNLGDLQFGSKVNLERAMPSNGRFGGHIVSGHIDGIGQITKRVRDDNAVWITVSAPHGIMRYIVEKGSIAIDGISLTVARAEESGFSVSVIPHTGKETTLLSKSIGDTVNLENDIVGKYIDKFININKSDTKQENSITLEFLERSGF
jgi:riboflavin synthase